jgi:hypothetical protein
MSLPIVQHHVADITNVDVTSITFSLPASIPAGAGVICVIGAYKTGSSFDLVEDSELWTRLDSAGNRAQIAEALIIGRVTPSANVGGSTVTVDASGQTATAIVHVFVITNWFGDFTDGFATVPHNWKTSGDPVGSTPPPITVTWPSGDQHLVCVWSVSGRSNVAFVATPAGYTSLTNGLTSVVNSGRGINVGTGYKELLALTETPGDFSNNNTFLDRYTGTFAIRGVSNSPSITLTQTEITPGGTISGSYSNWGGTAPTKLEGIRGANSIGTDTGEITGFTVTGDGASGTFTATIADLPATSSAQYLRLQAAGIVDVTWRLT